MPTKVNSNNLAHIIDYNSPAAGIPDHLIKKLSHHLLFKKNTIQVCFPTLNGQKLTLFFFY